MEAVAIKSRSCVPGRWFSSGPPRSTFLPRNCELVGGAVFSGAKRATVLVRRWPDNVRGELADGGVCLLVETMYGGARERIVLPPAVSAVAFGGG